MRMRTAPLTAPLLAILVACSSAGSFKDQTEAFLDDATEVEASLGADVEDAECEEPADTEIGTIYTCTARVDGVQTSFTSEIIADDRFSVTLNE